MSDSTILTSSKSEKTKGWRPEGWRKRVINWHLLRGFGQSVPATISMSAPFIGYLVLYHSEIETYLGGLGGLLEKQASAQVCSPWFDFPTRLNILYLGLMCLGLGAIAFRVFAPAVIKSASNKQDYVTTSLDSVSARNLRAMYVTIKSRRPSAAKALVERAPWLDRSKSLKTASDGLRKDEDGQLKMDVLSSYYSAQDRNTSRFWVYFVLILFAFGFSLLALPGLAFTQRVLCVIYSGWFPNGVIASLNFWPIGS
ncbi:hypothetical protein K3555_18310 [Leisingera sp. M527]|uniref:hypothetical protein n=1 Tax=Leisingera sp. M527 TaxID=2867014 RepID=UPI0021A375EE|nr:hypothetical protein [Leisingera sp. M527]UWQ32457.1 hypothetical protein K3555_18310 [Leisingera sp. M527]